MLIDWCECEANSESKVESYVDEGRGCRLMILVNQGPGNFIDS